MVKSNYFRQQPTLYVMGGTVDTFSLKWKKDKDIFKHYDDFPSV